MASYVIIGFKINMFKAKIGIIHNRLSLYLSFFNVVLVYTEERGIAAPISLQRLAKPTRTRSLGVCQVVLLYVQYLPTRPRYLPTLPYRGKLVHKQLFVTILVKNRFLCLFI